MNVYFNGITVQLIISGTMATLLSPGLPGLTCTLGDLRQLRLLLTWELSGTLTLDGSAALEVLLLPDRLELRQEQHILLRVTPKYRQGEIFDDMNGLYAALRQLEEDEDDTELQPAYGFLMKADPEHAGGTAAEVWNTEPRLIGQLLAQDIPVLRSMLGQGTGTQHLTHLLVDVAGNSVTLFPDNRPVALPSGHHQVLNLQTPLELTSAQARKLADDAEFLINF